MNYIYSQLGPGRHPDVLLLRALVLHLAVHPELLALWRGPLPLCELLAGGLCPGHRLHLGGHQHRPLHSHHVAPAATHHKTVSQRGNFNKILHSI